MKINSKEFNEKVVKVARKIKDSTNGLSRAEAYYLAVKVVVAANKIAKGVTTESAVFGSIANTGKLTLILKGISISTSILLDIIDPSEEEAKKREEKKARREERKAAREAKKAAKEQDDEYYDLDDDDDYERFDHDYDELEREFYSESDDQDTKTHEESNDDIPEGEPAPAM